MKFLPCHISGPLIIEPQVFADERGFFMESWSPACFQQAGLDAVFVQDNHSRSQPGVLRGLHFQNPTEQGKLVRVTSGAVFDVVVDLRQSSPTFGQWKGVELSAANHRMLWVPAGFAHGFLALQRDTDVLYKCTAPYAPDHEHILAWDDPDVGIEWPSVEGAPILSEKDKRGRSINEIATFP